MAILIAARDFETAFDIPVSATRLRTVEIAAFDFACAVETPRMKAVKVMVPCAEDLAADRAAILASPRYEARAELIASDFADINMSRFIVALAADIAQLVADISKLTCSVALLFVSDFDFPERSTAPEYAASDFACDVESADIEIVGKNIPRAKDIAALNPSSAISLTTPSLALVIDFDAPARSRNPSYTALAAVCVLEMADNGTAIVKYPLAEETAFAIPVSANDTVAAALADACAADFP